jgi:hypothetical protein
VIDVTDRPYVHMQLAHRDPPAEHTSAFEPGRPAKARREMRRAKNKTPSKRRREGVGFKTKPD